MASSDEAEPFLKRVFSDSLYRSLREERMIGKLISVFLVSYCRGNFSILLFLFGLVTK